MNQRKMGRKLLSFLLALAMVVSTLTGIVPGTSLTVKADDEIEIYMKDNVLMKGDEVWTTTTSNTLSLTTGSYVLTNDITTTASIVISGNVTLDLNGYGISANISYTSINTNRSVIIVNENGYLTLKDSQAQSNNPEYEHGYYIDDNKFGQIVSTSNSEKTGTFTGGYITGGKVSSINEYWNGGGGVFVKGTLVMQGGTIIGNGSSSTGTYGGGVALYGASSPAIFYMLGGAIIGNIAGTGGGGVASIENCSFNMNGGKIIDNYSNFKGGGLFAYNGGTKKTISIDISDGTISNNNAKNNGGGLYVENYDGSGYENYLTFSISGGTICNNTAAEGGGLYLRYINKAYIKGGSITNNTADGNGGGINGFGSKYYLTGTPEITGNTVKGKDNNIYNGRKLYIQAGLANTKPIGLVDYNGSPSMTTIIGDNYTLTEGDVTKFECDNPLCEIYLYSKDNELKFRSRKVSVKLTGGDNSTPTGGSLEQKDLTKAMDIVIFNANSGYYFEKFTSETDSYLQSGITITRQSSNSIKVSGTPKGDVEITIPNAIAKTNSNVATPPAGASELVYNGTELNLLSNLGDTNDGTIKYAVTQSNEKPETSAYTSNIPKKTNAGTYYVWYMVAGDDTHNDNTVFSPIEVTIDKMVAPSADSLAETQKPTSKQAEYTGEDVDLLKAPVGLPDGYTGVEYKVGSDAWSGTIPQKKDVDSYTVRVKYLGDVNHKDLEFDIIAPIVEVNKDDLNEAISTATDYYNTIKDLYNDLAETLNSAITTAGNVKQEKNVTSAQVSDAISALRVAVDAAKCGVIHKRINANDGEGPTTIQLTEDVTGDINIPAGKKIILDLVGHTINGGITVEEDGECTITDSIVEKNGKVTGKVTNGGTLIIGNGLYDYAPSGVGATILKGGCYKEAPNDTDVTTPYKVQTKEQQSSAQSDENASEGEKEAWNSAANDYAYRVVNTFIQLSNTAPNMTDAEKGDGNTGTGIQVGDSLKAVPSPANATSVTYVWYSGGDIVQGVTGSTYTVRPADVGKIIKVKAVQAANANDAGSAEVETSIAEIAIAVEKKTNTSSMTEEALKESIKKKDTSITLQPSAEGYEYTVVTKDSEPGSNDWKSAESGQEENGVIFNNLNPGTEYDVYARAKEDESTETGTVTKTTVKTDVKVTVESDTPVQGGIIAVRIDPDVNAVIYKWYIGDSNTPDGEGTTIVPSEGGKPVTVEVYDGGILIGSTTTVVVKKIEEVIGDSTEDPVTITLDGPIAGGLDIPEGKKVELDLNGKEVSGDINVPSGSELTITDSSNPQNGTVKGDVNANTGKVTIKGGLFDKVPTVTTPGTVSIEGGRFKTVPTVEDPYGVKEKNVTDEYKYQICLKAKISDVPKKIEDLVYTGEIKNLISSGITTEGTIYYAIGDDNNTSPEFDGLSAGTNKKWNTSVPTGVNAGNYNVWYKIVGDETHADADPECITVEISKASAPSSSSITKEQKPTENQGLVYTGEALPMVNAPTANLPTGYTVEYSVDNGKTWKTDIPTITDAGDYTVMVKYKGDNDHEDFAGDNISVTIAKAESSIDNSPEKVDNLVYNGSEQYLVSAGSSVKGGTLQYAIGTNATTVPTMEWGVSIPKEINANIYYVWYKVAGDKNHNDTTPVCISVEISKVAAPGTSVTKEQKPTRNTELVYTGNPLPLVNEPVENLPTGYTVEYSTDNGKTWKSEIPTGNNAGDYTVKVRYKGDANHEDFEGEDSISVNIGKHVALELTDSQKPTGQTGLTYTGDEQILVKEPGDKIPVGYTKIVYVLETDEKNVPDASSYSETVPSEINTGTYYIWYKAIGDSNHEDTTPECIPVEISKAAALDVEDLEENQKPAKETDIVYTGEPITLVKKPAGTLPEGYTGVEYSIDNGKTWTTTIPDGTGAGEYTVKVKYKGDNNHEDFSGDDIKITISKAEPTNTTKPAMVEGITYTGSEQNLVKAGNTTGGELQYAIGTDSTTVPTSGWSNIIPKGKNTGTYYVWYKVVGDDNYNGIDPECVTVNIAPKEITISGISGIKKTYDGTDDATFNCPEDSVNGVKEGDDIVVTANGTYGSKDVGTGINVTINEYTISGQDKDNYTIAESGNDNETKADITVRTVNDSDDAVTSSQKENEVLSYDGDGKAPTLNVKIGDTDIDNYTVTYKGVAPTTYNSSEPPVNAGNYIVIITFNGNCTGTREVSFTIMKGEQDTPNEKLIAANAGGDDMADGTISGLDSTKSYEYSSDDGKTWTKVETGKTSINVEPATYQIRYAENDNSKPSEPVTVFVGVSSKTTGVVNFKKDTTSSEPVETIVENAASSNIEEIAALQGEAGKDVKVELEILPKNEEKVDKTSVTKINEKAHEVFDGIDKEKIVMEFLEINLEKYVDSNKTGRISDTTTPLEIELMLDKSKAGNPVVIRTHEGVAKVCERLTARPTSDFNDGTYYVGEGKLYIYSQYFSDYAIVYATEKTHYVTIDLGNGETIQKVVGDNDKIKLPTDLTREGSSFSGWYKDKDYTNTWNEEVDTINSDTVLYAKWNKLVSGVTVEVDNVKLTNAGETSQIYVTVTPDDADNKKVSFVSSNPEVATVDADGVITAVANGKATITITTEDGSKTANVNVTVEISDNTTEVIRTKEAIAIAMNAGYKIDQKGSKINIKWGKVKEADGYDVYVAYCGKKFGKPVKTITNNGITSVKVSKIKGEKIELKKNFKVYIASYKVIDGNKVVLGKTITGHVVGRKSVKYTNVKKIKLSKSKYTVKVGKTKKIKAKTVLVDKSKKQLTNAHAKEFRYATSNKKIAKVSKKGKIKGIAKGTCIIYVYARNGYAKKVKVTVK